MRVCKTVVIAALALGGCATITEGTTQNIRVEVVPDSGTCVLIRKNETIGASTPGQRMVTVSKESADIEFKCSAPGYQDQDEMLSSALSSATVVSFFLLDLGIVDAVSGAWKKYPERLTVVLQPAGKPPAPVRGARQPRPIAEPPAAAAK